MNRTLIFFLLCVGSIDQSLWAMWGVGESWVQEEQEEEDRAVSRIKEDLEKNISLLRCACIDGSVEKLEKVHKNRGESFLNKLIQDTNQVWWWPISLACEHKKWRVVEYLLTNVKADVFAKDVTTLRAVANKVIVTEELVPERKIELLDMLVERGFDVDNAINRNNSLIEVYAQYYCKEIDYHDALVKWFIKNNVSFTAKIKPLGGGISCMTHTIFLSMVKNQSISFKHGFKISKILMYHKTEHIVPSLLQTLFVCKQIQEKLNTQAAEKNQPLSICKIPKGIRQLICHHTVKDDPAVQEIAEALAVPSTKLDLEQDAGITLWLAENTNDYDPGKPLFDPQKWITNPLSQIIHCAPPEKK